MNDDFELAVVEQVEPKTYRPPAYLDEQNITPDTFIINFAKFLPMYIAKNRPATDTMSTYETAIRLFFKWCNENNMHPLAVRSTPVIGVGSLSAKFLMTLSHSTDIYFYLLLQSRPQKLKFPKASGPRRMFRHPPGAAALHHRDKFFYLSCQMRFMKLR